MKSVLASAILCCSLAAYADNETMVDNMPANDMESDVGKFNIVLAGALTFGGDELNSTTNDRKLTAGGLLYLAVGGVYHASSEMDIQAAVGAHVDAIEVTNGTAEFTRSFIELMPFYVMDSGNRFGLGVTRINSPEYTDPVLHVPFKDTNGIIVEFDWMLARHYFLGVRYADITYNDIYDIFSPVNGSYFGVLMEGHF